MNHKANFKKIISSVSVFLVLSLSLIFTPTTAMAVASPSLTIDSLTASEGENINVTIKAAHFSDVAGITLTGIQFDDTFLSYTGYTLNTLPSGALVNRVENQININWSDFANPINVSNDTLLTLNFTVISAITTDTSLTFTGVKEINDSSGNQIEASFVDGVISLNPVVDNVKPTGVIAINEGDEYTNSRNATLNFSDVSEDVTQIQLRNGTTGSFQSVIAYENPHTYMLPDNGDGTYTVSVRFIDAAGNQSTGVISDSIILNTIAPVITLSGDNPYNLTVGDIWTDPGATALDDLEGDISPSIVIGGDAVDTNTPDAYTITYNVFDAAGNPADEVTRTVNVNPAGEEPADGDNDGVPDEEDNCPSDMNAGQEDNDGDGIGNVCDGTPDGEEEPPADEDGDGVADKEDNCPGVANPEQVDTDGDGTGDDCDETPNGDDDGDGVDNGTDNCLSVSNSDQTDTDGDSTGDACDDTPNGDDDGDGVDNATDNCPAVGNSDQTDTDSDGIGDACDETPSGDEDGDGVDDETDNCPSVINNDQTDTDGDGSGDECDETPNGDDDGDGVDNEADNCSAEGNSDQTDTDGDGTGDACDETPNGDTDGDGVDDETDNCPETSNSEQEDNDDDGTGNACDDTPEGDREEPADTDDDGVADEEDNCPLVANSDQADNDGDSTGDACDETPNGDEGDGGDGDGDEEENNEFTLSEEEPEAVLTDAEQAVTITILAGTEDPSIDVSALLEGATGNIPQMTINSDEAEINIPATTITGPEGWNGIIAAPTVTTVTLPETQGETKTLSAAIEIGFASGKLSFDNAVRILLPDQAGKRAGYVRPGEAFTEITATCAADNQETGDALPADGDCKIDIGSDLVIWTKHFTSFATYSSQTSGSSTSSGSGSRRRIALVPATSSATGEVLGAEQYVFTLFLKKGPPYNMSIQGNEVTELQKFLNTAGYGILVVDGKFGPLTEAAVKAFQIAHPPLVVDGIVGPLTRAVLNQ